MPLGDAGHACAFQGIIGGPHSEVLKKGCLGVHEDYQLKSVLQGVIPHARDGVAL